MLWLSLGFDVGRKIIKKFVELEERHKKEKVARQKDGRQRREPGRGLE